VAAPALLITSDAPVTLTLDGQSAGHLNADQPQRFVLAIGEHQVLAKSDVEGVEFRSTAKLTQPGDQPLAITLAAQITKKQTPAPAPDPDAEEEAPAPVHTGPQVMPGDFVMVAELDSEPRPLAKTELAVPNSAKGRVVNGFIIVLANIDEHGNVTDASLMRGLEIDYGLNQAAVDAAKKAKFTPGIKNGVPVKTAKSLTYKIVTQ
jgi:TonB family protein